MAQPRTATGEQLSEMLRCRFRPAVATVKQQHLEYSGVEIVGDFRRGANLPPISRSSRKPRSRQGVRRLPAVLRSP
jgi:hypothetical protein